MTIKKLKLLAAPILLLIGTAAASPLPASITDVAAHWCDNGVYDEPRSSPYNIMYNRDRYAVESIVDWEYVNANAVRSVRVFYGAYSRWNVSFTQNGGEHLVKLTVTVAHNADGTFTPTAYSERAYLNRIH